jgi:hypothetical protein
VLITRALPLALGQFAARLTPVPLVPRHCPPLLTDDGVAKRAQCGRLLLAR